MLSTNTFRKSKMIAVAAALSGLAAAAPAPAHAGEGCRDVKIEVINQSKDGVKVYDMKYYDFGSGKWRNEATRNRILGVGQSWTYRKRLEWVGGEMTLVEVQYRTAQNGKWRVKRTARSPRKTCYRGSTYRVVIR